MWAVLTVSIACALPMARAQADDGRVPLAQVLDQLQTGGLRIVYSNQLVESWMRAVPPPETASPERLLRDVLEPFGLQAVRGRTGAWLVVAGAASSSAPLDALTGVVIDAGRGHALNDVTVTIDSESSVRTDEAGRFAIFPYAPGAHSLTIKRPGYLSQRIALGSSDHRDVLGIELTPVVSQDLLSLEQVQVQVSHYEVYGADATSQHFLSREDLERVPHLADDANRALHRLPGVAAGDWSARFHVRGGRENEVALILDGLELFDPFHLKDLFSPLSMVDANVIESMELFSGGFTALYGDYASGVVDINTLGAGAATESEVGVSFVNAFARSQGNFADYDGQWLISVRRGYLDLVVDEIDSAEGEFQPRYYDVFAKAEYRVSDRLTIAAHILAANDDLVLIEDDGDTVLGDARNGYAWITIDGALRDDLHSRTVFSVGEVDQRSRFDEPEDLSGSFVFRRDERQVRLASVRTDWTWLVTGRQRLRFGAELRNLDARYDYTLDSRVFEVLFNEGPPRVVQRSVVASPDGDELGAYVSHKAKLNEAWTLEAGLRFDKQTYTDLSGQSQWSPRLNLLWQLRPATSLRLAWGRFAQPQRIDELQVADGVSTFSPAQRATHMVASVSHTLSKTLDLRAEIYRKDYDDVLPRYENILNPFESAGETEPDRVRLAPDTTRAQGFELTFTGTPTDHFSWWAAYTWSNVEDRIDGIDVPRNWDFPHTVSGGLNWGRGPWNINAGMTARSGRPTTTLDGRIFTNPEGELFGSVFFDVLNEERLDSYARLDMRITRDVDVRRGRFQWFVELYNVLDTTNDCCVSNVTLFLSPGGDVTTEPKIDPWLPRIPSFGFSWVF